MSTSSSKHPSEEAGEASPKNVLRGEGVHLHEVVVREKVLTFDEASKCLNTLSKDESSMRYAYIRFTACDQKLTDIATILNFRHVLFVDVSGNYLRGAALQTIAALPFLVQLRAERNFVETCALKPMCYLQDLSLARNRIRDTIGVIQPELEHLDVNYNQIYQVMFPAEDVPMLKELEMRGNLLFEIGGTFPKTVEKLYLAENNITRIVGVDLATMPDLQVLHVRQNGVHKLDGFSDQLAKLRYLNVRQNRITKLRQFRKLRCLPALEVLIFMQNPVSGDAEARRAFGGEDDDEDEELGEDREVEIDPNRVAVLALLPDLKRINKVAVTFVEREYARLNRERLIKEVMDVESSDDEGEPVSSITEFKTISEENENEEEDEVPSLSRIQVATAQSFDG